MQTDMLRRCSALALAVILAPLAFLIGAPVASASEGAGGALRVLLLGDSYTAGNGASAYDESTCHRSAKNWAHIWAGFMRSTGVDVDITNRACQGAVSQNYDKNVQVVDGQSHPLQAGAVSTDYDLVMLSLGGNDLGFGEIVKTCFIASWAATCKSNVDAAAARSDRVLDDVRAVLADIASRTRADARIVYVSYPKLELRDDYTIQTPSKSYRVGERVRNLITSFRDGQRRMVNDLNRSIGHDKVVFVGDIPEVFDGREPDGVSGSAIQTPRSGSWMIS